MICVYLLVCQTFVDMSNMEEVSQFEKPFFRHPFTAIIAGGYFLVLFKSWLSVNNKLHFINILFFAPRSHEQW